MKAEKTEEKLAGLKEASHEVPEGVCFGTAALYVYPKLLATKPTAKSEVGIPIPSCFNYCHFFVSTATGCLLSPFLFILHTNYILQFPLMSTFKGGPNHPSI
jgi:hypothetical protein